MKRISAIDFKLTCNMWHAQTETLLIYKALLRTHTFTATGRMEKILDCISHNWNMLQFSVYKHNVKFFCNLTKTNVATNWHKYYFNMDHTFTTDLDILRGLIMNYGPGKWHHHVFSAEKFLHWIVSLTWRSLTEDVDGSNLKHLCTVVWYCLTFNSFTSLEKF